jgi:hypothetical protein
MYIVLILIAVFVGWLFGFSHGFNWSETKVHRFIEEELRICEEAEKLIKLSQPRLSFKDRLEAKLSEMKNNKS